MKIFLVARCCSLTRIQQFQNPKINIYTLCLGRQTAAKKRNKRRFVANPWQKKTPPWGEHLKKGQAEPKLK